MYYIIHETYVGPNIEKVDEDFVYISTEPARANLSGEPRDIGWCGTTNDISVNALGSYSSVDEAKLHIHQKFEGYREEDEDYESYIDLSRFSDNDNVVFVARPGLYIPMSAEESEMWFGDIYQDYINDYTTDKDIYDLVISWEQDIISEFKSQLDVAHSIGFLMNYRDELIEESKYD